MFVLESRMDVTHIVVTYLLLQFYIYSRTWIIRTYENWAEKRVRIIDNVNINQPKLELNTQ